MQNAVYVCAMIYVVLKAAVLKGRCPLRTMHYYLFLNNAFRYRCNIVLITGCMQRASLQILPLQSGFLLDLGSEALFIKGQVQNESRKVCA